MEECCVICAEPLQYVAYGPCGHRDACVECVARLRFVMADQRCVICQQTCPLVFCTRAMGDYTASLGEAGFGELHERARSRELVHDKPLDMFFDDPAAANKVKELRGLQCGACVEEVAGGATIPQHGHVTGGGRGGCEQHGSLKHLKAHLRDVHALSFCEVCLEGRKVFVSQQLLYSKQQLDKHKFGGTADKDNEFGQVCESRL